MPVYEYLCEVCGLDFDVRKKMSESSCPEPCPQCQGATKKQVVQTSFVLVGDDWGGKANRVAGQMRARRQQATVRQEAQKRDAPGMTLAPNVEGERVDSWGEAAKLAKSKGKATEGYSRRAKVKP